MWSDCFYLSLFIGEAGEFSFKLIELIYFTFIALFWGISLIRSPIILGYILVLSSILAGLILGSIGEKWFIFIFFLIFTGGIIVIILYITNMAANQKIRNRDFLFILIILAFLILPTRRQDKNISKVFTLVDPFSWELIYFIIAFLLLGLFLVVFLVEKRFGALR